MRALSRLALRRGWSPLQATHPGTSLASRHLTTLGEQDVIAPPGTFEQTDLPTTVVCDLGAIENNVRQLRRIVGPDVLLAPALKSNAYGHGAVAVGHAAVKAGVDWIAVASIAEAMQLREAGITVPMLCMGFIPPNQVHLAVHYGVKASVAESSIAEAYAAVARDAGRVLDVHVKVDTGMGRFGVSLDDAANLAKYVTDTPELAMEGMYTHFSAADDDDMLYHVEHQVQNLDSVVESTRAQGIKVPMVHCANSAATMRGTQFHRDMVRVGISLYGLQPGTGGAALPEGFRPALSWHTQVAQVKHLPKGHNVGYGNTYTVERAGNYALVPTGYGDGYRRGPHNYGRVLIGGARCPVLGRVSMEKILIGLWPAEENGAKVQTGDPVVLIGRQGDAEVSVEEVAHRAGTNNYEVCTAALPRGVRRTVNNPDGDGRVSRPYTPKA